MSQAGTNNTSGGPVPPTVATSYVTDVNSPAIPAANILNVLGRQIITNNDNGIQTDGSSGSNTTTVQLTNRLTGTLTTTTATITPIITFALGATPGVYYISGSVQAFGASGPNGGGYTYAAAYLTDGTTATELGTEYHDTFETASMVTSDIHLAASGNNAVLSVQGLAGPSLNWNSLMEYRRAT